MCILFNVLIILLEQYIFRHFNFNMFEGTVYDLPGTASVYESKLTGKGSFRKRPFTFNFIGERSDNRLPISKVYKQLLPVTFFIFLHYLYTYRALLLPQNKTNKSQLLFTFNFFFITPGYII